LTSFGNFWIIPFNYDPSGLNREIKCANYSVAKSIYEEFGELVKKQGNKFE